MNVADVLESITENSPRTDTTNEQVSQGLQKSGKAKRREKYAVQQRERAAIRRTKHKDTQNSKTISGGNPESPLLSDQSSGKSPLSREADHDTNLTKRKKNASATLPSKKLKTL